VLFRLRERRRVFEARGFSMTIAEDAPRPDRVEASEVILEIGAEGGLVDVGAKAADGWRFCLVRDESTLPQWVSLIVAVFKSSERRAPGATPPLLPSQPYRDYSAVETAIVSCRPPTACRETEVGTPPRGFAGKALKKLHQKPHGTPPFSAPDR
jgi:hypothetical protein